jgi:hypothetical protein
MLRWAIQSTPTTRHRRNCVQLSNRCFGVENSRWQATFDALSKCDSPCAKGASYVRPRVIRMAGYPGCHQNLDSYANGMKGSPVAALIEYGAAVLCNTVGVELPIDAYPRVARATLG